MFHFVKKNGLDLMDGRSAVLKNIKLWLNPIMDPWTAPNMTGKFFLEETSVTENEAVFTAADGTGKLTLTLSEDADCFALKLTGSYCSAGTVERGTHLDNFRGLGFDCELPHKEKYVDAFMGSLYWQRPFIGEKTADIKPRTQALFLQQAKKTYLTTTCDKDFKSEIFPNDKHSVSLICHANTILDTIDDVVLVGGTGENVYALPETVTGYGLKIMNKPGKLRRDKKYPEVLEYLGWCSWDAFHMDVTEQDLLDKCQEFKEKNIPVKWMIIDDMWGDVTSIDRRNMHRRDLNAWEADPIRFPNGLKGAITHIKENYDMRVGMWHPTSGYWYGVNPNGRLAKEQKDVLEYTIPGLWPDGSRLMHSFDRKKAETYYDRQHAFYKDCGADFTKVDNQGSTERFSFRKGSIGACTANLHNAIEKAAKKYYGGALINCMGMPIENFWNRTSNVNRFSGDFQPENRQWFVTHLLQCSYNSLTQGTIYTGDWDMWWSDDEQAKKNAVLRSMSGGPIYMSDELGRSIREVIMPTVYTDGKIIRLKNPAVPAAECLFEDAQHNGKIYKVINNIGAAGVTAAFNLDENEKPVSGRVTAEDMHLAPGTYCVYDWFNQQAVIVKEGEQIDLTLNNYDDFRLLLWIPVKNGKAVIGLKEKYMAPATVEQRKNTVTVKDEGTLLVYAEEAPAGFTALGDGLYEKTVTKDETVTV